jgi:hypothetical protein
MTNRDSFVRTDGVHTGYFAGERRQFALPLFGELRTLQDRHDMGPLGFVQLFQKGLWKSDHIVDVIKFGLIGAGTPEKDADELVREVIRSGRLLQYAGLAHEIMLVTLGPLEDDEPEPAKKKPRKAPAAKA